MLVIVKRERVGKKGGGSVLKERGELQRKGEVTTEVVGGKEEGCINPLGEPKVCTPATTC
jgi:hypothetical protein